MSLTSSAPGSSAAPTFRGRTVCWNVGRAVRFPLVRPDGLLGNQTMMSHSCSGTTL